MPGPKMGPRPVDFDEGLIRQSPTFAKWLRLEPGEKLRYACRDFIRGHEQDEERLMRRIMIARRNNLRDHEILKRARKTQDPVVPAVVPATTQQSRATASSSISSEPPPLTLPADVKQEDGADILADHPTSSSSTTTTKPVRKRRPAATFSDAQVAKEMDVVAVEATRSYKSWAALEEGAEFVYNQKYVKGKEGHDWLLRKNIWRRMRYRRENKKMVTQLKHEDPSIDELVNNKQTTTATRPNPTSQKNKQAVNGNASKASGKGDSVDTAGGKKRGTRTRTRNNAGANGQRGNNKETAGNKRGVGDSFGSAKASKMPKLEGPPPPTLDDNLPEDMPMPGLPSSPNNNNNHDGINNNPEDPTHAALTAAAAATASGGADDLVELSAVEAAVAAAATYVQLATQQHEVNTADDDDDDDDDGEVNDDLDPAPVVHNPLEAAANAAALDSAAKLAAATTAQDAHLDEDDEGRMGVSI